jgi:3-oxoacyl-(acyl-carrier-protein) synthase
MSAHIAGIAWITPLGADLDTVWQRLVKGDAPQAQVVTNPETGREHRYLQVPPKLVAHLARHPRMRRSSSISFFAAAAGLAALENAGITPEKARAERTAVVLAVSDGSVVYTRRFYDQIVKQGANAASPLLFPETVYNAPASHLAALMGIDGASYTLVGDNSVGLAALHFANQLLALGDVDCVLVVGAEEIDWVLCEAYRDWRFARTPLAEGAAAVVLAREGRWKLRTHLGMSFARQRAATSAIDSVLADFAGSAPDLIVASANGTFVDRAEAAALARWFPGARTLQPKGSFGEAPGASALLQVVTAARAIECQGLSRALVPVVGFNQQASAAQIERA